MTNITVHNLLKEYKTWVEQGDIQFLKDADGHDRQDVVDCVAALVAGDRSMEDST